MRLADLIINCVKETLHNDDTTITVAKLRDGSLIKNPDYATELNNVLLSINKAVARLMTAEKIAPKTELLTGDADVDMYDISSISDIRKIRSISYIKNGQPCWVGWKYITPTILFLGFGLDSTLYVVYDRYIPSFLEADIDSDTDIGEEYGLTDELCHYINYFVKSELFEDIDPDRSKRYLNYFEQFVAEVNKREQIIYQDGVQPKYKI